MTNHNCKLISNDHSIIGVEDGIPKMDKRNSNEIGGN
jgi:hypothetical protein